jgi:Concanavalin A-like lectin/glucanases superfamily
MQRARLKFLVGVALALLFATGGCQREVLPPPFDAPVISDARASSPDTSSGKTLPPILSIDGAVVDAGGTVNDPPALDVAADLAVIDGSSDPAAAPDSGPASPVNPAGAVVWAIDNLQSIGGHRATVLGAPTIIDTPEGKALQFDGQDDALFVDNHPLARLSQFTVEIFFRPDPGGSPAQRWFHMQDDGSASKVLFETRLFGSNFVLDVFVESPGGEIALYAPQNRHPLGAWYHVAAVVDGQRARHYVNGVQEMDAPLAFRPHGEGRTSIGVRITRMYYFKGAIRMARFTPRALTPDQFLKPPRAP